MKSKILVLDIEGTTTPISFVSEILFPFAAEQFETYLQNNWQNPGVLTAVNELFEFVENEEEKSPELAAEIARDLIRRDVKLTALKTLQGKIWRSGYESGELKGALFQEVARSLQSWSEHHRIFIYSSGSVEAQKLLFGFSEAGDLCPYFEGHFDTKIGSKKERQSYEAIAQKLGSDSAELYFLTDSEIEAHCSKEAGWNVILMVRPGNATLVDPRVSSVPRCKDFDEVSEFWDL